MARVAACASRRSAALKLWHEPKLGETCDTVAGSKSRTMTRRPRDVALPLRAPEPWNGFSPNQASRPAASAERVNLGEIIKGARKNQGWTLDDASQRTGVARSTLSKIENGNMSPTYDLLYKIAVGMNLDLVELFDTRRQNAPFGRRSVTRANQGKIHKTSTYVHELLATDLAHKKMLPFKTTIKARKIDEFGQWIRHEGEEFMLVLAGTVEVHTEFYSPVRLSEGGSIYFDSKMGHALLSVGPRDAEVIWVCTGLPSQP